MLFDTSHFSAGIPPARKTRYNVDPLHRIFLGMSDLTPREFVEKWLPSHLKDEKMILRGAGL